ncbi:MAG: hypothetical protein ACO1TE_11145 [Prosthecobacter sp.]
MNVDWHDLVQRQMAEMLDEEEALTLQSGLRNDPQLRRLYLHYMSLDVALEAHAGSSARVHQMLLSPERAGPTRWRGWLQWRPMAAAAAGVVVGLFGATMVWAFAANQRGVALVHEGFEASPAIERKHFPESAGTWSVVGVKVVGPEAGVSPKEGAHMLRLEPRAKEKTTRMYYVVDLGPIPPVKPGRRRQYELRASFHAAMAGRTDHYMLRAAAFADDLSGIDRHWMLDQWGDIEDHALASAARSLKVPPSEGKWEDLSLTLDVPAGARILVLSVWAATLEEKAEDRAAHYVDDIRLSYFTHEPPP